jgi:hypothetical protein
MSNKTNEPKRPTHAIFQVVGESDKARWIRVGAAWPNKDSKGFTLKFDAYPVVGRTVIREITEQSDSNEGNGGQS